MLESRCHICLQPLENGGCYHPVCCKRLFGVPNPPSLPYSWGQINDLAERFVRRHVTVPGAQPKLSVHLEPDGSNRSARFTLVGLDGNYVLKPPVERFPEMPELEHMTMCMARACGISTAECGLIPLEDGRLSYITKRMDRNGDAKLHMEDMCQLTDRLTDQKYRGSMEQVGKAIRRHCSNPMFDVLRLFDVSLFCFLTGNADMHLKNFSLLYRPGGEIALSPAYDLLPTVLLLPQDTEETALTLNGRKQRLTASDFEQFGTCLGLTGKQIDNARSRLRASLPAAFEILQGDTCSSAAKQQYTALMDARARRLDL